MSADRLGCDTQGAGNRRRVKRRAAPGQVHQPAQESKRWDARRVQQHGHGGGVYSLQERRSAHCGPSLEVSYPAPSLW